MSDEEEDYMSDKFLASLSEVRPSLIQDRAKKRQVEVSQRKQEQIKRQREERLARTGADRNERLQESLQRPIEEANKGFQLLAKMGYKPGESLGKSSSAGTSIKEPIGISIKTGRGGLGREAALRDLEEKRKELREKYFQRMRKETESVSAEEYRRRVTAKAEERFLQSALRKCQGTCENLDISESKLQAPSVPWFWPERLSAEEQEEIEAENKEKGDTNVETSEEEEDEIEYSTAEKLDMLMSYLRTSYNFCHWCGVHYTDVDDMEANCPGTSREDH